MEAPPQDELWSGKSRRVITLTECGLSELPEKPSCPTLEELFLQNNPDLTEILPSFFLGMPQLHILDLSNTSIKSLPKSISSLFKLRRLLLRSCELLSELPPEIGELCNLEMLDLEGTELICLPMEIKWLLRLKLLNVSFYESVDQYKRFIPPATLSRLSLLEELSINVNQECGSYWYADMDAIISELATLGNLRTLKLFFPTVELLQKFLMLPCHRERDWCPNTRLVYQTLRNFRLTVGCDEERVISCLPGGLQDEFEKLKKCLKYVNGEGSTDGIGNALEYANALFLDRHWTIGSLSVFEAYQTRHLEFCLLAECNEMKTIVDEADLDRKGMLTNGLESLVYLSIHCMENLESIWNGPGVGGWLLRLEVLAVHTCPKLSTIFDIGVLRSLVFLKELIVEECPQVQSLVKIESSHSKYNVHSSFLQSLEKISLLHLPELVSIFNGLNVACNLEKMVVYNCPKLKNVSPIASEIMKEIKGESKWWEELEWQSNQVPDKLVSVFVPLARDGDLIDQLEQARSSINILSMSKTTLNTQLQVTRKGKNIKVPVKDLEEKMTPAIPILRSDSGLRERLYGIPKPPDHIVGLNAPLEELKGILLKYRVQVVVISAPVGRGKTVLAKMLCNDKQIQAIFQDIFFVTVSKKPNLKVIVRQIFEQIGCQPCEFHSDEDAVGQVEHVLRATGRHRVLIVLDDVRFGWQSHIQNLMFQKIPGYKILVTSRCVFPQFDSTYKLNSLNDEDSMTLFHNSASQASSSNVWSSNVPDDLVNEIVRGCKEFPLALVVVGQFLCLQPERRWREVLKMWSEGKNILYSDSRLIHCLHTCIDICGIPIIMKYYLDLGAFPQYRKIPASALMDMWMELYRLDEKRVHNTHEQLLELSSRNLVNLEPKRKDANRDDMEHYDVTLPGLLRELAIHHCSRGDIEYKGRLIVDIIGNDLPYWWKEQKYQSLRARLLSISTDDKFSSSWFNMQLPEVEVVILNFQTQNYTLPLCMERMHKLKALIITNCGFDPAELNNFELLGRLFNLRRIRLEHISISPLGGILRTMWNLRKISLIMCNMEKAFQNCTNDKCHSFPYLVEISMDNCVFKEFPAGLCDLVFLKKLSISNCHELYELPNGLGRLTNLESLTLHSCVSLGTLPESIGELSKLEFLDISYCVGMNEWPSQMGELLSLIKLNVRGCVGITEMLLSFVHRVHLRELVCDEKQYHLFKSCEGLLPRLRITVI